MQAVKCWILEDETIEPRISFEDKEGCVEYLETSPGSLEYGEVAWKEYILIEVVERG